MMSKKEILEELRLSRIAIARDTRSIAEGLNLTAKIRRSVTARPLAWLGSAAAIGYILAGPKTRKAPASTRSKKGTSPEKPTSPRGGWQILFHLFLNLGRILLPILRPAISAYAAQRLADLSARFSR